MPMEQETMGLLIGGLSITIGVTFIVVLLLLFSKKRKPFRLAYTFIIGFLLFFSLAASQAIKAITFDVSHPMASEEISLRLILTIKYINIILKDISMLCCLLTAAPSILMKIKYWSSNPFLVT
jgi:uncharacterized membrane protein